MGDPGHMTSKQYDIELIGGPFEGKQATLPGNPGSSDVEEKLNVIDASSSRGQERVRYKHSDDCNRRIVDGVRHYYHFDEGVASTINYADGVDLDLTGLA